MLAEIKKIVVKNVNQKIIIGIVCVLASFVLWLVPMIGCLLCNISFVLGLIFIVLGVIEEQKTQEGMRKIA